MHELVVVDPGGCLAVQDGGRPGMQHLGLGPAGAADKHLYALAGALVDAQPGSPALEFTASGPTLQARGGPILVSVVGDAPVHLAGSSTVGWRSFVIEDGQLLHVGALRTGWRGYIGVHGLRVPTILGSASQHQRLRIGPFDGQPLQAGAVLHAQFPPAGWRELCLHPAELPLRTGPFALLWGPEVARLDAAARQHLLQGPWRVDPHSDRMALTLDGEPIHLAQGHDLISDATTLGCVQLPGDGRPRVLLADRQPTGGYARVAVVASVDAPRLHQLRPGEAVSWRATDLQEAADLLSVSEVAWQRVLRSLRPAWPPSPRRLLSDAAYW